MEKRDKINKSLINRLLLASALGVGAFTINYAKVDQIKEITSTYQGYTADREEGVYLIFDDKTREAREDLPVLTIQGNPDTLKIGERYTVKYAIKNWNNVFPNKIKEIKYAKVAK